jgi:hypothetical protein
MPYLSQFEVLATPIFPPVEPEAVPFVIQGYFVLISRLEDGHAGDLQVELNFFATPGFPAATGGALADLFLVDYQNETGTTSLAATFTGDKLVVPVGSGKTVLAGIQPNAALPALYAAAGAIAPNAPPIAARGYVTIDIAKSSPGGAPAGEYTLAVTPEIRATFLTVTLPNPPANLLNAQTVAYSLPTPNGGVIKLVTHKH